MHPIVLDMLSQILLSLSHRFPRSKDNLLEVFLQEFDVRCGKTFTLLLQKSLPARLGNLCPKIFSYTRHPSTYLETRELSRGPDLIMHITDFIVKFKILSFLSSGMAIAFHFQNQAGPVDSVRPEMGGIWMDTVAHQPSELILIPCFHGFWRRLIADRANPEKPTSR